MTDMSFLPADARIQWDKPCEALFEYLGKHHPQVLLSLVQHGGLDPCDLTFAAEILGKSFGGIEVVQCLERLLDHGDAAVREGALYGIAGIQFGSAVLLEPVRRLSLSDPSQAVRRTALDLLEVMQDG